MTIILFYVLLVLVSGLVAYLGDLLGRHIGKRRIKIFKLRPRYSAILITSVTGSLITLLTILVMLGTNQNLKVMMLRSDAFDKLTVDYNALTAEAKQSMEAAQAEIAQSDNEKQLALDQLKTVQQQLTDAKAEQARLELERTTLQQEQETLKTQLASLDTTVTKQRNEAARLQGAITERQKRLDDQKREIDANAKYIEEQEANTRVLRQDLGEYQTGDVVIAEGTPLVAGLLQTTQSESELV
ncbi:MAG: DUF3084 domain-containing protein, partial [bacterium]